MERNSAAKEHRAESDRRVMREWGVGVQGVRFTDTGMLAFLGESRRRMEAVKPLRIF